VGVAGWVVGCACACEYVNGMVCGCVSCVGGRVGVVRTITQDDCKREGEGEGKRPLGSEKGAFVTLNHAHTHTRHTVYIFEAKRDQNS
jgi:hypothetical protein